MAKNAAATKSDAQANIEATLRVGIGYGWMKVEEDTSDNGRAVLSDVFWKSLKKAFTGKHTAVERLGVKVGFSRLRASHGKIIWDSVIERIKDSDILIFDVAAAPDKDTVSGEDFDLGRIMLDMDKGKNVLNANVLVEIGAAIALGKRIMLLCPYAWREFIPSDLKGYLWTFYNWRGTGRNSERCFVDEYGVQNGYIGMLREVAEEKLGLVK